MPIAINVRGLVPNSPHVIYLGRKCAGWPESPLSNPFKISKKVTRSDALAMYNTYLSNAIAIQDAEILSELQRINDNSVLGCWCKPQPCHVDIVIEMWQRLIDKKSINKSQRSVNFQDVVHLDAFVGRLDTDGFVYTDGLDNPSTISIAVVEFQYGDVQYYGLYDNNDDMWEIVNDDDDNAQRVVARCGNEFYSIANATLAHFSKKILAGPIPDRLIQRVSRNTELEVMREIDKQIINDLRIASGIDDTNKLLVDTSKPLRNRKLRTSWSLTEPDFSPHRTRFRTLLLQGISDA